jgi:hypothetical protein
LCNRQPAWWVPLPDRPAVGGPTPDRLPEWHDWPDRLPMRRVYPLLLSNQMIRCLRPGAWKRARRVPVEPDPVHDSYVIVGHRPMALERAEFDTEVGIYSHRAIAVLPQWWHSNPIASDARKTHEKVPCKATRRGCRGRRSSPTYRSSSSKSGNRCLFRTRTNCGGPEGLTFVVLGPSPLDALGALGALNIPALLDQPAEGGGAPR